MDSGRDRRFGDVRYGSRLQRNRPDSVCRVRGQSAEPFRRVFYLHGGIFPVLGGRGGGGGRKKLGEPFGDYARYLIGIVLLVIYTFLWSLLLFIPGIIKGISYSMTYYIMRENPGMSGEQAIQRSMAMMRGHKMQYFLLFLSFIGWAILALIPAGLGFIWLIPYMYTAQAAFYEELKKDYEAREAA